MAKKRIKKGFCLHCHHDVLFEWCYDYDGRVRFIKERKPLKERTKRLLWFQPVKGKLPVGLIRARERLDKVSKVCDKAQKAYYRVKTKATRDKWDKAWDKALKARYKADTAYDKALKTSQKAIEKLHAKECPDCSWNGKTLVF